MFNRRGALIVAISVVAGATFVVSATFTYMLTPMLADLGLSKSEANLALRIPSLASLLVVFVAGRLGDRLGHRHVILWAGAAFIVGSAAVALAEGLPQVALGLLVEGVGATAIQITIVALLAASFTEPKARAGAFATYGMSYPIVYLVFPVIAGQLATDLSWRWIPVMWMAAGLVLVAVTWLLLPRNPERQPLGELWTPVLAGVFVTLVVQALTHAGDDGLADPITLASFTAAFAVFVIEFVLLRRMRTPSLSLTPLRNGATTVLLAVVLLVPLLNTWWYVTLAFQYVYGLSVAQTALAMLPAQAAAIVGAKVLGGRLMRRYGNLRAGTLLLSALTFSMLGMFALSSASPLWMPIVFMSVFGLLSTGVTVVLINTVMSTAPGQEAGNTSALRASAASIGSALGYVVMSAIVFGFGTIAMTGDLEASGLDPQQAQQQIAQLQASATSPDAFSQYSADLPDDVPVTQEAKDAMVSGLRANSVAGFVIALVATGLFSSHRRWSRLPDEGTAPALPRV